MNISIASSDLTFFFFQAEDGIRDYKVTGVQTCALPICIRRRSSAVLLPRWRRSSALRSSRGIVVHLLRLEELQLFRVVVFAPVTGKQMGSGEGRGGEEGRSRWGPVHLKKKKKYKNVDEH